MRNREIRFRAWHSTKNEWLHDTEHACNILGEMILLGGWCNVSLEELNDVVVMQFTGLCDKHGVEVFEGDIVKGFDDSELAVIVWVDYGFEWTWSKERTGSMPLTCIGEVEVVGNIYQNPELVAI